MLKTFMVVNLGTCVGKNSKLSAKMLGINGNGDAQRDVKMLRLKLVCSMSGRLGQGNEKEHSIPFMPLTLKNKHHIILDGYGNQSIWRQASSVSHAELLKTQTLPVRDRSICLNRCPISTQK